VYADHGNFFIAISVGMLVIEKESFAIVSAQSPIGTKLIGLKQGDSFQFAKKTYRIDRIG
ncbi:MAG TPA: hypothetical protein VGD65_22675, partial [Chryseosolibacter sp.]